MSHLPLHRLTRLGHACLLGTLLLLPGCGGETVLSTDPADLLDAAWADFRLAEYDLGIKKFKACLEVTEPGSDEHLLAQFGIATSWNLRQPLPDQDKDLAKTIYREIIAQAPKHDLAAWSQLALARIHHLVPVGEDPDYDAVRAAYEEVIQNFPGHLAAHEALIYQQSTWIMTLEKEDALGALAKLTAFIEENPTSTFLSMAYNLCALGYETIGEHDKQVEARVREFETVEIDPTSPFADHSKQYWQIATTAEFQAGDFITARKFYKRLVEEYPVDIRTYSADQALERMDALEAELRPSL